MAARSRRCDSRFAYIKPQTLHNVPGPSGPCLHSGLLTLPHEWQHICVLGLCSDVLVPAPPFSELRVAKRRDIPWTALQTVCYLPWMTLHPDGSSCDNVNDDAFCVYGSLAPQSRRALCFFHVREYLGFP